MKTILLTLLILTQFTPLAFAQDFILIFGADQTPSEALFEVRKVRSVVRRQGIDINEPKIYYLNGWYQSGITFRNEQQARDLLPTIQNIDSFKESSYIRNLNAWCPNPVRQREQPIIYYTCE